MCVYTVYKIKEPHPSAIITDDHFPPRAIHPPSSTGPQITAYSSATLPPGAATVKKDNLTE